MKELAQKLKEALVGMRGLFMDRTHYRPAHCGNIKMLLLHLCDMDNQLCLWVLRWVAFQLRNPDAKMATGIVVTGSHPGKDLFFNDVLEVLFGAGSRVITANQLHDRSPSWAAAPCSMVIVHGIFAPHHAARLRAFITAESFIVKRPGQAPETLPNHLNFVFSSGEASFIPEYFAGRRFAVVETPPGWPRAFLDAVKAETNHGGVDAFLEYLTRDLDMGTFNESTLPPLPALRGARSAA